VECEYEWRGPIKNGEANSFHVDAFGAENSTETDWILLLEGNSLGWVTARDAHRLVGSVNVISDGQTHAWIQELMVSSGSRHMGIGSLLVAAAREASREAGCRSLHADFEERLGGFHFRACGFQSTTAGIIELQD
jgi:GNAT superfamily N-acetyltransferase